MFGQHKTEVIGNIIYPKEFFKNWTEQADALGANPDWVGHKVSSLLYWQNKVDEMKNFVKGKDGTKG